MLAVERHREILSRLEQEGSVRVARLADALEVTEETIRRDLGKLEAEGRLVRSHGGAVPAGPDVREETPFWYRETVHETEKAAIAAEALSRIAPGDRILLDASTTTWHIATRLEDVPLTVVTNSIRIAASLSSRPSIEVVGLGGGLARRAMAFVGPAAEVQLRQYHVDTAFLSCGGVDLHHGVSDVTEAHAHLRRIMMEQADRTVLLADHSKFAVRALARFAALDDFDELITDGHTDPVRLREIRELGVSVHTVPVPRKATG